MFPVNARMFFLTADTLAVVDATAAGDYFASEEPVSREIEIPDGEAMDILNALHNLAEKEKP